MRLAAVSVIGLVVIASPTKFGSEAILLDHWRTEAPQVQLAALSDLLGTRDFSVPVDPVPSDVIQEELAELREPEGPPPPPADVPIEFVCHTLASAAQAHGLPTGFFARLIWQESKFKQRVVSSAGAQGVAQFMPAVAAERGLRNPFDPLAALPHSARFLKEHVKNFGNIGLAAAAYNAGTRRVMDWLARRGKLPEETRNYVKLITGQPPEKWTQSQEIDVAVDLPKRAPCEGVADLTRDANAEKVQVQVEPAVAKVIEEARIAAAKAAAEAKAKLAAAAAAAAKAKRARLLANAKGGKTKTTAEASASGGEKSAEKPAAKPTKAAAKIADRPSDKPASAKPAIKVADTGSRRMR